MNVSGTMSASGAMSASGTTSASGTISASGILPRGRKKADPESYARNIRKKARLHGKEYVGLEGTVVPSKSVGPPCECKEQCYHQFSEKDRNDILRHFLDGFATKNEQDIFLQGLMEAVDIVRRRPNNPDRPKFTRPKQWKYFVLWGVNRVQVCFRTFLSLHAVSEKRVRRLRDLLMIGRFPDDLRGKSTSNALPIETIVKMDEHIRSFPLMQSHSGISLKFFDASLNLKIMYDLFKKRYPTVVVSYRSYVKHFRENFDF